MKFDFEKEAFINSLREMTQDYGRMILKDEKKCYALWLDYAPQLTEEGELLKDFLELGLGTQAIEMNGCSHAEQEVWRKQAVEGIVHTGESEKDAVSLVDAVIEVLGWDTQPTLQVKSTPQIESTPQVKPTLQIKPAPDKVLKPDIAPGQKDASSASPANIKKQFMNNYLIEELFASECGGYSIYLYAGWQLMALCTNTKLIIEFGEPFWCFISEETAFNLIKHSADFADENLYHGVLEEASAFYTFQQSVLDDTIAIKAEVERGERETLVSEEGLRTLKEGYIVSKQKLADKYGMPPHFSNATPGKCMAACLLITFGVPYWLVGRPLPALLHVALSVLMCCLPFNPIIVLIMTASLIITFSRIVSGKFKDGKGRYVLSAEQKEDIIYSLNLMERYKEEVK